MIQLTFHDSSDTPAAVLEGTDFRMTGGVLWNHMEHGLIARYACGSWKHRGKLYPATNIRSHPRQTFRPLHSLELKLRAFFQRVKRFLVVLEVSGIRELTTLNFEVHMLSNLDHHPI